MLFYPRVLPRDAFNESNLLKCIGKLTLQIEDQLTKNWVYDYDQGPFEICQSQDDGSIYVANINFQYKKNPVILYRPLNTRTPWQLYMELEEERYSLFNLKGKLLLE